MSTSAIYLVRGGVQVNTEVAEPFKLESGESLCSLHCAVHSSSFLNVHGVLPGKEVFREVCIYIYIHVNNRTSLNGPSYTVVQSVIYAKACCPSIGKEAKNIIYNYIYNYIYIHVYMCVL